LEDVKPAIVTQLRKAGSGVMKFRTKKYHIVMKQEFWLFMVDRSTDGSDSRVRELTIPIHV
jgi:hypothetical protein